MTDTSEGAHPLKQRLATPPAQPASACFTCYRPGTLAADQRTQSGARLATLRFECLHCVKCWTVNTEDALAHGRFLRRIDVNRNTDA